MLWLVLRWVLQEQTYTPALFPPCWVTPQPYRAHKVQRLNPGIKRSAPVPCILKRNVSMSPMEEWWLFLSDRGIPLGTEDHFCRPALSMFFFDLSFQYDLFHSSTWKNMLRVIPAACTAKSITIRIEQGSISCPNTDDKEVHTNSVPDFHYLWKWQSKYIQDRQVIPKEPQAPSARTGWDWNKYSGDPKL